ncbi:winged helix-turn-helix transcriptional regulator [Cohnella caldifontis]|uniref:winged helix-turn-helix transcriptional regulator n=1 Tax=Cohnella caldifontis TaxID=3027471 RepID=UPI0023EDA5B4|nr:helix-turn-helix domain-containing protein [Cohnella sp. YIM B05605]
MKDRYDLPCNIAQTLNIIGDRWTLLILHEVLAGHHSFNQIKRALQGLSSRLLSERLKYLEAAGLLRAELVSEHPPRFRYALTESGQALEHVFNALILWGRDHLQPCYKKLVHAECGHEVRIAYRCSHCGTDVSELNVIPVG